MPLTPTGRKVMSSMKQQYGDEKAERVFYRNINKGKAGSETWHGKKKHQSPAMQALRKRAHG